MIENLRFSAAATLTLNFPRKVTASETKIRKNGRTAQGRPEAKLATGCEVIGSANIERKSRRRKPRAFKDE
ncbi:hypothetical protein Cob_v010222 [Colletotrichum orbiculare MAFF 240422]|uniref:Uncharacterized protein n=1 Tax=Colletotrichum orbiculare (strain 104-T / ATCC 96160 / CBS 514.97 / LARS 414 / MAFF 240422) TaxID=1213857 RepID=A0A484FEE9_COLOR|nr:hypothetical protein Cob_v010222 [Colletotrichum orbiculare MAFF 240422]